MDTNTEHRDMAIFVASQLSRYLQLDVGNNVASWAFDVLADNLIKSTPEELRVIMNEMTDHLLKQEDADNE